ncbi:MAG: sulfite exporter TauE/SafE family protein [Gammaproteobacteria bacterium]|nr:sulfite exporter TauE/SafE family protein [Gammaproteobacteria bacterium]
MPTIDLLLSDPAWFALLALAAFLVGLSKGGLPAIGMLSVPILSLSMPPLVAAVLLLPIYILSDIVSVWLYRREFSLDNVKVLVPAGILGVLIGWATASFVSDRMVSVLIGMMGISFCLHQWTKKKNHKIAAPTNIRKGLVWGTLSGFTSFVSHAGAPPFQIYVLPQRLPKMVFAGTSTIVFASVNLAKVIPYSSLHPYTLSTLKISLYLLPVAAIGTVVGKKLIERLSEKWFFLAVQIALFIISAKLIVSSLP